LLLARHTIPLSTLASVQARIHVGAMVSSRKIVHRVRGHEHGFIRRMVSPGDIGEAIKPFVFLDHVNGRVPPGAGFGWHPHSGIATLTYQLNADAQYEDTAGQKGLVAATGLEWMRAGGGTWHQGFIHPHGETVEGFQLWVALPPELENGAAEGIYVPPTDVPQVGNVRVLLGEYQGARNPIPAPSPIVYLDVVLRAGEQWTYMPAPDQTVAWAFPYRGEIVVGGEAAARELLVFEEAAHAVTITASTDARLLFGCARKHDHGLVLGSHSVHTSEPALRQGVATIREVGRQLSAAGRL